MNIFRFAGDVTHLISILVLLLKIYATKSCSGKSFRYSNFPFVSREIAKISPRSSAEVFTAFLNVSTGKFCCLLNLLFIFILGISLKTQELYALVFLARYLDLFTDFVSVYNTVMKVVFIVSSVAIVWCMRVDRIVRRSYDKDLDTFRHHFLILTSFLLALLVHEKFTFQEIFWAVSIYLEALAILPQLVLLQRSGNVDNLTGQYVLFLGYA
ncbi:hypothetical protein Goarm_002840 [Gossypium armourianum]|uniref:ER lumen protein-retaining receptor n=1 Tax=Gossypium armourianum TaxID=34283 RepID=A0A7J9K1A7_9ROSI|nr:hypothetical protein [Gossypium armourianum]